MFTRTSRIGMAGLMIAAVTATGGAAQAGLLSANSGGAIAGFTGTQLFDDNFLGTTVSANVDYAVFAPGTFGVAFPGLDPSNGSDYVYAYQIENLDTPISTFTVGLDGDESLGSIGFVTDAGLLDPIASTYVGSGPTSASWDFTGFNTGLSSAVLIFTSADAPERDTSTVAAEWSNTQYLPSPLPEPASFALFAAGLGLACMRKRNRV